MPILNPSFSIGVEEEYMLVDLGSRDVVSVPPPQFIAALQARLGDQVSSELMAAQVEVGTKVCRTIPQLREELSALRTGVAEVAGQFEMAPIAASTHPFANWRSQKFSDKPRYQLLGDELQAVGARSLIGGMHVHVGIEDDDLRIDLLNQVCYFLPHLLCASTSSPFWEGENTGLMSYRTSVFSELPRTGLPDRFESFADYEQNLAVLQRVGVIEDATKIWWDVRPSARFPTIEMRITDICTYLDDAICVAALFRCVLSMLVRLRRSNLRWRQYPNLLISENRWRAQRYGLDGGLFDFGQGEIKTCKALNEELIDLIRPDAVAFDCVAQVEHLRTITERGTSAHHQLRIFNSAMGDEETRDIALARVVDHLVEGTVCDL